MPDMVTKYNKGMGGVDLLDSMVATYRIPIRSKKWWFPFYTWSLSVSVVNAWKLKCHATGGDEPLLDFLRELVVEMLKTHGKSSPAGRSVATLEPEPGIVYEIHHWPTHTGIGKDGKFRRLNCMKEIIISQTFEIFSFFNRVNQDITKNRHVFKFGFIFIF